MTTAPKPSFIKANAGMFIGVAVSIAIQVIGAVATLIWLTATLSSQMNDLRREIDRLQQQSSAVIDLGKSAARSDARLDGIDKTLTQMAADIRQLTSRQFGQLGGLSPP